MDNWLSRRTFPVLRGPLAGKKWVLGSRINFFLGTYEPEQTQAFQRIIKPGDVVYDVGAHYGYYTLLSSILTGEGGKVFAFEPSPANISRLHIHLQANGCANVAIEELALSDQEGTARFDNQTGSGTGHLSSQGSIEVRTATLDGLASRLPPPRVVKIDCEGAEVLVLKGGEQTLRAAQPAIFLSTHGEELKSACFRMLEGWGYAGSQLHGDDFLFTPKSSLKRRSA